MVVGKVWQFQREKSLNETVLKVIKSTITPAPVAQDTREREARGKERMMKDKVLRLIDAEISRDADNLRRAEAAFGRMSTTGLDREYGQSGKTCREIWDGYKNNLAESKKIREWFLKAVP